MRLHKDEGHYSCGSFFIPIFRFNKYLRNQNQRPKGTGGHRYDALPQGFANNTTTTMIHVDGLVRLTDFTLTANMLIVPSIVAVCSKPHFFFSGKQ